MHKEDDHMMEGDDGGESRPWGVGLLKMGHGEDEQWCRHQDDAVGVMVVLLPTTDDDREAMDGRSMVEMTACMRKGRHARRLKTRVKTSFCIFVLL